MQLYLESQSQFHRLLRHKASRPSKSVPRCISQDCDRSENTSWMGFFARLVLDSTRGRVRYRNDNPATLLAVFESLLELLTGGICRYVVNSRKASEIQFSITSSLILFGLGICKLFLENSLGSLFHFQPITFLSWPPQQLIQPLR